MNDSFSDPMLWAILVNNLHDFIINYVYIVMTLENSIQNLHYLSADINKHLFNDYSASKLSFTLHKINIYRVLLMSLMSYPLVYINYFNTLLPYIYRFIVIN